MPNVKIECQQEGDWTEKLIAAVESRPALFDYHLAEYTDRAYITRLWQEICQSIVPRWRDMTATEKSVKEKDVQSKWRNLRTCFRRELNKQKSEVTAAPGSKRRKYIYYDRLLFLLPILDERDSSRADSEEKQKTEPKTKPDKNKASLRSDPIPHAKISTRSASTAAPASQEAALGPRIGHSQLRFARPIQNQKTLLSAIKRKTSEGLDEDETFLLSLIPSFKRLNDIQKLDAKIEFLSILKSLAQSNQGQLEQNDQSGTSSSNIPDAQYFCDQNMDDESLSPTPSSSDSETSIASKSSTNKKR